MNKIIKIAKIEKIIEQIKVNGKTIVLAGGCFDIIHKSHVEFLEKAKAKGDILILLLESDQSTKKYKGENRPINTQIDRAFILAKFPFVDLVVLLPFLKNDQEYLNLVEKIKPDIIAVSQGDKRKKEKANQAKKVKAELVEVIRLNKKYSSSKIVKKLEEI